MPTNSMVTFQLWLAIQLQQNASAAVNSYVFNRQFQHLGQFCAEEQRFFYLAAAKALQKSAFCRKWQPLNDSHPIAKQLITVYFCPVNSNQSAK